jgi:outer membrane protein
MKNKLATYVASCLIGTTLLASPAFASNHTSEENSPWLVRVRALGVLPETSKSTVGAPLGGSLKIDNQVTPELDISYFFT